MRDNAGLYLTAENGASVALRVVSYQFAEGDNWYDSNWLIVAGEASCSDGAWTFRDPCLLTIEAVSLGRWLVRSADASLDVEPIDFLEPHLGFDRLGIADDLLVLRIAFDLEARPPFAGGDGPYLVDLPLPVRACASAGESWLEALRRFPSR